MELSFQLVLGSGSAVDIVDSLNIYAARSLFNAREGSIRLGFFCFYIFLHKAARTSNILFLKAAATNKVIS